MEELFVIGICEDSLKTMVEINSDILNLSAKEILDKINILKELNCSDSMVKNIIESNPFYLSRSNEDIFKLIMKLSSLGITRLDITIDSNPWILNNDSFEIDDYIEEKKNLGFSFDEIIDMIDAGMFE